MEKRSLLNIGVSLVILGACSLPLNAQMSNPQTKQASADEVYIDNNCRRNQRLEQIDRFTVFYKSEFRANGQIYLLSAGRYQDGGVLFCISRPNFSEARRLNAQEIQSQFIDKIVRDSNNNAAFVITVAEGNGSLIPYTAYGLDLSNPNSPVIQRLTLLQQQGTLQNGDSVLSSDRSLYDIHTFEGRAGQSIRIILESAFANYLVLIDPSGKKIAENYSNNQNFSTSEINVTLPSTGIYRVFVNGRNRSSQGPYALSINRNQLTVAERSPNSGEQTARGRAPNQARSANSSNMTSRPQVPTWNQFVASLKEGEDHVASDFDLPQEFRNGYVYRIQGANWIGVYILKAGLPSYPIPGTSEINQVTFDADRYIQSGQAIHLFWNLSYSAVAYANDNQVRFPEKGRGCLAITCLTAPSMSNAQISSILRSERGINTTASATSNTQRSPNSGQQTATGRSPATSGSRQELVASNLGCTRNLRTILGQRAPDYCTSADAYSGIIFDNVKPPTRNADGSINLEMTVLNRGSADGFVEIYDSRGNLVKLEVIESSSPPTDLIRNINPFDERSFPASFFSNYPIGDLRRSLKRQDISVTIPAGGYAKVTKYGNVAFRYNSAMLALELTQAAKGDPEFVKSEQVKNFIKGFAEEAFFAPDSKAVINIFKSSPSLQAQFNMNVIDPNKLAEVLQELLEYSVKIEKDPSKNPFIGAFQDVFLDTANIGLENALNLLRPGLGTFASGVREGGNYINILARAADLYYSMASGEKATVTIRDASTTGAR